jgi:hypothetical protein
MRAHNNFFNPITLPSPPGSPVPGTRQARLDWAYDVGQRTAIRGLDVWSRPRLFAAAATGFPIGLAYLDGYLSIQT